MASAQLVVVLGSFDRIGRFKFFTLLLLGLGLPGLPKPLVVVGTRVPDGISSVEKLRKSVRADRTPWVLAFGSPSTCLDCQIFLENAWTLAKSDLSGPQERGELKAYEVDIKWSDGYDLAYDLAPRNNYGFPYVLLQLPRKNKPEVIMTGSEILVGSERENGGEFLSHLIVERVKKLIEDDKTHQSKSSSSRRLKVEQKDDAKKVQRNVEEESGILLV